MNADQSLDSILATHFWIMEQEEILLRNVIEKKITEEVFLERVGELLGRLKSLVRDYEKLVGENA